MIHDQAAMDKKPAELQPCQLAAIRHVFEYSKQSALATATGTKEKLSEDPYYQREHDRIAGIIRGNFPIDVHFHPDRIAKNSNTVIDGLLSTMTYQNQYVSGISNGLLDTSAGSSRERWESRLFGCAYDTQPDSLRPKYGAVNLFNSFDGACPRFGSCYLRLNSHVHQRCTLSYGDSNSEPEYIGTSNSLNLILTALHKDYFTDDKISGIGISLKSVSRKLQKLQNRKHERIISRILDDILEAHLHGELRIDRDVEFISADSSFAETEIGNNIIKLAANANIILIWRPELRLQICAVPPSFRGKNLLTFMKQSWQDGHVSAYRLGQLAKEVANNPDNWTEWGRQHDVSQLIKQTWHAIAAYGEPVFIDQ